MLSTAGRTAASKILTGSGHSARVFPSPASLHFFSCGGNSHCSRVLAYCSLDTLWGFVPGKSVPVKAHGLHAARFRDSLHFDQPAQAHFDARPRPGQLPLRGATQHFARTESVAPFVKLEVQFTHAADCG